VLTAKCTSSSRPLTTVRAVRVSEIDCVAEERRLDGERQTHLTVNAKRIYRLYTEGGLTVRTKVRRKDRAAATDAT
jgi:hypothetical protein